MKLSTIVTALDFHFEKVDPKFTLPLSFYGDKLLKAQKSYKGDFLMKYARGIFGDDKLEYDFWPNGHIVNVYGYRIENGIVKLITPIIFDVSNAIMSKTTIYGKVAIRDKFFTDRLKPIFNDIFLKQSYRGG